MYRAIWQLLCFRDDKEKLGAQECDTEDKKRYTPYRLHLQVIHTMIRFACIVSTINSCHHPNTRANTRAMFARKCLNLQDKEYYDDLSGAIAAQYGWVDAKGNVAPPGPFTLKSYFT